MSSTNSATMLFLLLGCANVDVDNVSISMSPALDGSAVEVWSIVKDSVVNFAVYDGDGSNEPLAWGTAICLLVGEVDSSDMKLPEQFIGKHAYVFLTARHMVDRDKKKPGPNFSLMDVDEKFAVKVTKHDEAGLPAEEIEVREGPEHIFLRQISGDIDAAVVILMTMQDLRLAPAVLVHEGASDQLKTGQKIYTVGCPSLRMPTFREGMISAVFDNRMLLDVGVAGGSSGGGAYDVNGALVGLVVASYNSTTAIAIPMNRVYDFFRKIGLIHPMMCE